MSYNPATDFLGLMRASNDGAEPSRMPGLDFIVAALSRAGLIALWTGQAAPQVNVTTTVWFKPANPSWTAEGATFLWDAETSEFAPANPRLWGSLLAATAQGNIPARTIRGNVLDVAGPEGSLDGTQVIDMLPLPSVDHQGAVPLVNGDVNQFLNGEGSFATLPSGAGFCQIGSQLLQWGRATVAITYTAIAFPKPFGDLPVVTASAVNSPTVVAAAVSSITQTQFQGAVGGTDPRDISWFAVGPSA